MIYSIDSMHLNHVPYAVHSEFSSASSVQQLIIPEQLNQIYIVRHRWKEQILSFPTIYIIQANRSLVSNFKDLSTITARHVSKK